MTATPYIPSNQGKYQKVIAQLQHNSGNDITENDPLPVSLSTADIEIGGVEIKNSTDDTRAVVKSDGTNNALVVVQNTVPTTTVTGSVTANAGTNLNTSLLALESGGNLANTYAELLKLNSLSPFVFDYITLTQAATTDTWKFYTGGSGGTLKFTITISYTDATKLTITNIART